MNRRNVAVILIALTQAFGVAARQLAGRARLASSSQTLQVRASAGGNRSSTPLPSQVPLLAQAAGYPFEKRLDEALTEGSAALAHTALAQLLWPQMQPEPLDFSGQPLPAASFIFAESERRWNRTAGIVTPAVSAHSDIAAKLPPQQLQLKTKGVAAASQQEADATSQEQKEKISPKAWWAFTFSFAFVVKVMCMLSNVAFQAAPMPQVGRFNKLGDTGEVDPAPFICIMYGGCQWCFYGMFAYVVTKKSGFLVLVYSNLLGAFLGSYYLWGFQRNCKKKGSLHTLFQYYMTAATLASLQLAAMLAAPRERALIFCGLVSSVCGLITACSVLINLPTVIRTRCSASMNLPMLVIGACSSSLWLLCGYLLSDPWLIIPNAFGTLFTVSAISIVMRFPGEESSDDAEVPPTSSCIDDRKGAAISALTRVMAAISVTALFERVTTAAETASDSVASRDNDVIDTGSLGTGSGIQGETGGTL